MAFQNFGESVDLDLEFSFVTIRKLVKILDHDKFSQGFLDIKPEAIDIYYLFTFRFQDLIINSLKKAAQVYYKQVEML